VRLAVAGGTGVVGKLVVSVAEERGHDVMVLSRACGVDLTSVGDLAQRLEGVDAVVDVSGTRTQRRRAAREFFTGVTTTLLTAGEAAGVSHHVALSIVGIEGVDSGYYAAKLAQEQLVAGGSLPWTILRATQFHEFAAQALDFLRLGPLSLVPRMRTQPVAAREVAQALVGIVETGPAGRVPDLAGPQVHQLVDLTHRVNRERGHHRLVVGVPLPGRAGRAMGAGALLPAPEGPRGHVTFDTWLGEHGRG
jgi:uncharacterized protein YbjT (DUF2867 family)